MLFLVTCACLSVCKITLKTCGQILMKFSKNVAMVQGTDDPDHHQAAGIFKNFFLSLQSYAILKVWDFGGKHTGKKRWQATWV